ncbi:MAG: hypothetical protein ACUVWA_14350 [Candidatus Oleimicrobiaceae bacterium]
MKDAAGGGGGQLAAADRLPQALDPDLGQGRGRFLEATMACLSYGAVWLARQRYYCAGWSQKEVGQDSSRRLS